MEFNQRHFESHNWNIIAPSDLGSEVTNIINIPVQSSSCGPILEPQYQLAALQPKNLQSYKLKWLLIVQQKL